MKLNIGRVCLSCVNRGDNIGVRVGFIGDTLINGLKFGGYGL